MKKRIGSGWILQRKEWLGDCLRFSDRNIPGRYAGRMGLPLSGKYGRAGDAV